jgi:hypothetical protein
MRQSGAYDDIWRLYIGVKTALTLAPHATGRGRLSSWKPWPVTSQLTANLAGLGGVRRQLAWRRTQE